MSVRFFFQRMFLTDYFNVEEKAFLVGIPISLRKHLTTVNNKQLLQMQYSRHPPFPPPLAFCYRFPAMDPVSIVCAWLINFLSLDFQTRGVNSYSRLLETVQKLLFYTFLPSLSLVSMTYNGGFTMSRAWLGKKRVGK